MSRRSQIFQNSYLEISHSIFHAFRQPGSPACSFTTLFLAIFLNCSSLSNLTFDSLQNYSKSLRFGLSFTKFGNVSSKWAINMPNQVPQSPTWLILQTLLPRNSKILQMLSPCIVDLRCPTCIFFAILGLEKSTRIVFVFSGYSHPSMQLLMNTFSDSRIFFS